MQREPQFVLSSTTDTQSQVNYAAGLRETRPADRINPEEQQIIRAEEQAEIRKAAELHMADHCSMPEYNKRRKAMRTKIVEPNLPLDEMTYSDYCNAREEK
jgi:hypothetical protein